VDSPVADYTVRGVDNERLSTGLAGLIGVLVTFGVGLGLFALLRTMRSGSGSGAATPGAGEDAGTSRAP
jgi:hypothetical protein